MPLPSTPNPLGCGPVASPMRSSDILNRCYNMRWVHLHGSWDSGFFIHLTDMMQPWGLWTSGISAVTSEEFIDANIYSCYTRYQLFLLIKMVGHLGFRMVLPSAVAFSFEFSGGFCCVLVETPHCQGLLSSEVTVRRLTTHLGKKKQSSSISYNILIAFSC